MCRRARRIHVDRARVREESPLRIWNDLYQKFQPTTFELPAYSADCVPFRWMLRENAEAIAERASDWTTGPSSKTGVDSRAGRTTRSGFNTPTTSSFFSTPSSPRLSLDETLVFVYAKESPLTDDPRRTS